MVGGTTSVGPGGCVIGMTPYEQAVEILRLIDGKRDIDTIIDELAGRYDAPRDVIAGDVVAMLQDLVDKKVLVGDRH